MKNDGARLRVDKPSFKSFPITFFNLEPSGRLLTVDGAFVAATGTTTTVQQNAQVHAYRPQDLVNNSNLKIELRCDVGTSNILQCAACTDDNSRTVFRAGSSSSLGDILRIDALPTRTGFYSLQFGIFTGADCA
jgi:hypothetical protein